MLSSVRFFAPLLCGLVLGSAAAQESSPLDKLDPKKIPALEKFDWQPPVAPNGKLTAAGGADTAIRIWDLSPKQPKLILSLQTHKGPVMALAFTADGKTLISGSSDETIRLWTVTPGAADKEASIKERT